jgi:hypothetical protein
MSDILYSEHDYLETFNNFITQLKTIYPNESTIEILNELMNKEDTIKINNGKLFASLFDDDTFDLFIKSKIKVFSHKNQNTLNISESLFGSNFCLKNLLNNQSDDVKKIIWFNLHTLVMITYSLESTVANKNRISLLSMVLNPTNPTNPTKSGKLNDVFGVEVNDETTLMMDDIMKSFENVLSGANGTNPMLGIMEVSQQISVKYASKINDGSIEMDKIMKSIFSKMPGMEKMMEKMMSGVNGGSDGMSGLMSGLMGGLGGANQKPKEKVIIDENFSTADVEVGKIQEEKQTMKLGSVLKMADSLGFIPNGSTPTPPTVENLDNGLSGLGGLAGLMGGDGAGLESLMGGLDMESLMGPNGLESLNSLMGGSGFEDLMKGVMNGLNGDTKSNIDITKLQKDMDSFLQTKQ